MVSNTIFVYNYWDLWLGLLSWLSWLYKSTNTSGGYRDDAPCDVSVARQDIMVAQYQKDGQVGPPPGACPVFFRFFFLENGG